MKKIKIVILLVLSVSFFYSDSGAQEKPENKKAAKETYQLESKNLQMEGQDLDNQILDYTKKIEAAIAKYKLMTAKDIRIVPYQISYEIKDNFIKVERHIFVRSDNGSEIVGVNTKSIKLFMAGDKVTKIESILNERNFDASNSNTVIVVDPSPTVNGTEDMTFTQKINGAFIEKDKKLGEIKNTTAFPVRNDLKRDFYIPHLTYFYNTIVNIAETYYKSIKDSEQGMTDFLKRSTKY